MLLTSSSAAAQVAPAATKPTTTDASAMLQRGRDHYAQRDCTQAKTELEPLAVPGFLADERDQLEVHRMLGICYGANGDERAATREFASMLAIDPDAALDPFEVPPGVVALFERQQQAMKLQLDEVRKLRAPATTTLPSVVIERTETVEDLPWPTNFLPLGIPQFLRGQVVWGSVLGVSQGLMLATNITTYWASLAVQRGRDDGVSQLELTLDNAFWWPHVGSLVLFAAAYGVGVVEAFVTDPPPPTTTMRTRPATEEELRNLSKDVAAAQP
jgi:hypothetical protein